MSPCVRPFARSKGIHTARLSPPSASVMAKVVIPPRRYCSRGRIAVAPGVKREGERRDTEYANPPHRDGSEDRAEGRGNPEQEHHRERLGEAHATKSRGIGDHELRGEGEEVVEHGADKCQRRDDNDAEDRVHPLTLLAGRKRAKSRAVGFTRWFVT